MHSPRRRGCVAPCQDEGFYVFSMEKKVGDVGEPGFPKTQGIRPVILTMLQDPGKGQDLCPQKNRALDWENRSPVMGWVARRRKGPSASPNLNFLVCRRE